MRPHGINQYSFLVYLLGLRNRVSVIFGTSLLLVNLSAYYAFVPSFCPSGYFRYHLFSPIPHDTNLESAIKFAVITVISSIESYWEIIGIVACFQNFTFNGKLNVLDVKEFNYSIEKASCCHFFFQGSHFKSLSKGT